MLLRPFFKQYSLAINNQLARYAAILLVSIPFSAVCQEINVKATLDSTGYIYETKIASEEEATFNKAVVIEPSITGSYASRRLSASLSANHSIVNRISDNNIDSDADVEIDPEITIDNDDSDSKNYTDLKYTSTLQLIENALTLTLNGTQSHRNVSQQQNFFSDKIFASGDLTKTSSNGAQLSFSGPNPSYLGFSLQSSYSKTKSDRSLESNLGLSNNNKSVVANLYQGRNVRSMNFNISAQYNETSRTTLQEFKSTQAQANFGFPIINKVDFVITGNVEEYDSGDTGFSGRPNIDTTSYGAGLKWKPSDERSITLTYNQLDERDNETQFIGLNLDWAFSSRTALQFDYGKRFYGDSYSLNFNHSLKSLRTSASYSEDVTTFSRLGASTTNITGIFVCQFGSTDLTDCFQPDSIDYQLQADEEFRVTTEIDTDISDEVLFRKSGNLTVGYDKRKVKISVNASYSQTEYLESNRLTTNRRLSFNLSYALGRKTDISFASNIVKNQRSESETEDTILTTSVDFKRDLTRYLKLNIGVRFLDRESAFLDRDGSDKRLTLGLNYTF